MIAVGVRQPACDGGASAGEGFKARASSRAMYVIN
jgi:hypothetical protein